MRGKAPPQPQLAGPGRQRQGASPLDRNPRLGDGSRTAAPSRRRRPGAGQAPVRTAPGSNGYGLPARQCGATSRRRRPHHRPEAALHPGGPIAPLRRRVHAAGIRSPARGRRASPSAPRAARHASRGRRPRRPGGGEVKSPERRTGETERATAQSINPYAARQAAWRPHRATGGIGPPEPAEIHPPVGVPGRAHPGRRRPSNRVFTRHPFSEAGMGAARREAETAARTRTDSGDNAAGTSRGEMHHARCSSAPVWPPSRCVRWMARKSWGRG